MLESLFEDGTLALRPTTAVVDLDALEDNLAAVRARVGARRVIAIVKANAYGHGLVRTAKALVASGADQLGVAFLEEGVALRRAGVTAPILVLGGIIGNQIVHFLEHDLDLAASSLFKLQQIEEAAAACGRRARIHLKVDTGMERIGTHWDTAGPLCEAAVRARHCDLVGIFSHLASADGPDPAPTRLQLERFLEVTDFFDRRSLPPPLRHLANSGALLQHPDTFLDAVRPGLLLYGVRPGPDLPPTVPVAPALSLHTRVVFFKVVRGGSPVSYDGTWVAPEDTRVVTLPVGYGDGYSRALSNKAEVLIGGRRHPVIGRVTMDATMVDLGRASAHNGDPVVLIGRQGDAVIDAAEVARWQGTIPWEVLTSINTRVPRRYVSARGNPLADGEG
jgi:alanine racemase